MPRPFPFRSVTRILAPSVLALVPFITGCHSGENRPPNLLVILVDTLRTDHLGSYGYDRDVSPVIDGLSRSGTRFSRAYATAPWTQPSVASLITGLYPSGHTVEHLMRVLPDSADTLAEILKRSGYVTGAVVSHWLIGRRFNHDQGYRRFIQRRTSEGEPFSTPGVVADAIELLERFAKRRRPIFLLVHLFDPHYDYLRHPEYGYAAPRAGRLSGSERVMELRNLDPPPDDEERALLRDIYDEELRYTDAGIGVLLEALERLGIADETLVVFTADHGEEFFERGWLGHSRTLYDELIRVPLILRGPGIEPNLVVDNPVSLVSLLPTLLDLLGIEAGEIAFHGRTFANQLRRPFSVPGSTPGEAIFSEVDRYNEGIARDDRSKTSETAALRTQLLPVPKQMVRKQALIRGRFKLIANRIAGDFELYDLVADPLERNDLADRSSQRVAELARELDALAARARAQPLTRKPGEYLPTQEEEAMLRFLGYVGP